MAHNTRGQGSPPSYIDGISVKISEKYKPPKRIALALSYSQRLTLNKLIQEPFPTYDFTLEESVKNRVHEWRKVRLHLSEERKQRLNILSEERKTKNWNQSENVPNDRNEVLKNKSNPDDTTSDISKENVSEKSHTYYSTESGVLIPMTAGSQQSRPIYQTNKGFNFSEFESDTSSPFDNMELKTINDLEELAEVLKRDSSTQPTKKSNKDHINGYYYNHSPFSSKFPYNHSHVDLTNMQGQTSVRTVTDIMKSLEQELATNHLSDNISTPEKPLLKPDSEEDALENPFNSFNPELQSKVRTISAMGFPLARVARACQAFDGNQKKIVEHLLAVSDLLILGFSEQKVVNALLKCNNDRDKALDLLIS